jgi:molybdopterin-guanine dinucleotide biosynthesis protein A
MSGRVLGVVISGGGSVRYGSPKALAVVGGRRVVDRATDALRAALPESAVVASVNDAELAAAIGLPYRPDALPGVGPLAGVHAMLLWAAERGCRGILAVGCDMPFVEPALLRELVTRAAGAADGPGADRPDAVIPASPSRRGVEPLCAYYAVSCRAAIEAAMERGDGRMIGFHNDIHVERLPLDVVRTFGDPAVMFLNVNTPEDRDEAERLLTEMQ